MSLKILHEVNHLTRVKARNNSKLLIILGCFLSAFFTLSFYATGVIQHDPLYGDMPLIFGLPIIAIGTFNAVAFTSLAILFLKSFGEYSAPKVVDGYWSIASKFILRERFKKNTADGIWDYVKLHRKHDPLYKADLEKLNEKIELNNKENQKQIEGILREIRIKNLALEKVRSLKNKAERERDQAIEERDQAIETKTKLTNLIRKLLTAVFNLRIEIKKIKGE